MSDDLGPFLRVVGFHFAGRGVRRWRAGEVGDVAVLHSEEGRRGRVGVADAGERRPVLAGGRQLVLGRITVGRGLEHHDVLDGGVVERRQALADGTRRWRSRAVEPSVATSGPTMAPIRAASATASVAERLSRNSSPNSNTARKQREDQQGHDGRLDQGHASVGATRTSAGAHDPRSSRARDDLRREVAEVVRGVDPGGDDVEGDLVDGVEAGVEAEVAVTGGVGGAVDVERLSDQVAAWSGPW